MQFGLRSRILFSYAIGGLALSLTLAGATLVLAGRQLIDDREEAATAVAVNNASRLSNQLTPDSTIEDLPAVVDSLTSVEGAQQLVRLEDSWLPSPEIGRDDLPAALVARVTDDRAGLVRTSIDGRPHLVIGVPLFAFDADYYEVVDLAGVDGTLGTLRFVVSGAAAGTTVLGALLGLWASGRTLRPLRRVRSAAEAIAGGRLDTRLEPQTDPDLDRLAESFNEMAGALEARIRRDARFASEVSHELRSPLTTLTSSVAVLEARRGELSDRSQTALDLLTTDLTRFSRLVDDLLEISRFDAGAAALDQAPMEVLPFINAALRAGHREGIPVRASADASRLVINGDKRRLGRVMANLFDNADRYGGGLTGISVRAGDGTVRIDVEDDGPGVAVAERATVFDRFSRGSAGGRRGDDTGSGLGLSMVLEDVRLHGGVVWVEDRSGDVPGACFVVELPRAAEDPDEEDTP